MASNLQTKIMLYVLLLCQLTCQSADIMASLCGEQLLLQKYKAQRHAVCFKKYLNYRG